jgi:peptide deformylase
MEAITIDTNEEYLRQVSKDVDINDKSLMSKISLLEKYCVENEVMAMAAIQLGTPERIIYLKNTNLAIIEKTETNSETSEERNYNESRILINPTLIKKEGLTQYWEACASCLDNMGLVKRPYKITVSYQDTTGTYHEDLFEGFEATVLAHEIDHLDGILHMDIAEEVLVMVLEERRKFRQNNKYHIFSKTGDYEELKKQNTKKL